MIHQSHLFKTVFYHAPSVIKKTIVATLGVTLFSLISHSLFTKIFHIHSAESLLSLSVWGVHHLFIWQFISYLFVYPLSSGGFSLSALFKLFFNLSLLWSIGCAIVQTRGKRHFIGLYFGGGLFIGLIAYLLLLFTGAPVLFAGPTRSIDILLIGWAFLFPKGPASLFFFNSMSARSFIFWFIGIDLLLDLFDGHFFSFFMTVAAVIYGYFYSVLVWNKVSPFPYLHPLDEKIIAVKRKGLFLFFQIFAPKSRLLKVDSFKIGKIILETREGKKPERLPIWKRFCIWRAFKKII